MSQKHNSEVLFVIVVFVVVLVLVLVWEARGEESVSICLLEGRL